MILWSRQRHGPRTCHLGQHFIFFFFILDVIIVFLIWGTEMTERHHCYLQNCCFGVLGEERIICMYIFSSFLDLCTQVSRYAIIFEFKNPSICSFLEVNFTQQRNFVFLIEKLLSKFTWLGFWKFISSLSSLNSVSFSLTCFFHSSIDWVFSNVPQEAHYHWRVRVFIL